ncbi:MAG: hypothetical protein KDA86_04210 [Planctomycetaceae bacterium]|nr:hypothetical protein [Planctomycetaceae bacterium]
MSRSLTTCLMITLAALAGCSSLDATSLFKQSNFVEAGPKNPVIDVVCLWEPAEGRGLDNLPTRGFAGQLLFLTRGTAEPAKVDGDVRVYLFDDQGKPEDQSKPIHQFDFKGGTFSQYLCETNMGAAYQLFIPYPRKGTHEVNCALRVRFTPAEGSSPVYSKMANVTLPGAKSKELANSWQPQRRRIQPAEVNSIVAPQAKGDKREVSLTTSIPMEADHRSVRQAQANSAHSRLQQVAAQLAEEADVIQAATYESNDESTRRFRLND